MLYCPRVLKIQRVVISGGNFKPDTLKPKEVVSLLLDDDELEKKCAFAILFRFLYRNFKEEGGDIEKIINCVFSSCSASETGGEEAAGGVQQGEGAQEKEGEVRREGTVQHVSYI